MPTFIRCPPNTAKAGQRIPVPQGTPATTSFVINSCRSSSTPSRAAAKAAKRNRTSGPTGGGTSKSIRTSLTLGRGGGIGDLVLGGPPSGSFQADRAFAEQIARDLGLAGCESDLIPESLKSVCRALARQLGGGNGGQPDPCPSGTVKVGDKCVAPGDAFPGGDPATFPAGGRAVEGSFGLPAITPRQEQRTVLRCPSGMRLGKDNLCYPKAVLRRRSKFRKHRPPVKPPISRSEAKAVRQAQKVKDKLKKLTKDHPGLNTAKNK